MGHTDFFVEMGGEVLRIEIEHRSSKEQIKSYIQKNIEYSDVVFEIACDEVAKKKVLHGALKTMFGLRKEKPVKDLKVRVASIDELKQSRSRERFEMGNRRK